MPLTRTGSSGPACLPGVGRFLAVLAAGRVAGSIGELGTGVEVVCGDAYNVLACRAPYDLVFADGGDQDAARPVCLLVTRSM
jgi:predicted O-methyltransferase YrrM